MKKIILFIVLSLTSCKQEEKVVLKEDFVFSYDNGISFKSFSCKDDTVFMVRNYPKYEYVFYYALENNDIDKINGFIDTLQSQVLKNEYIQESIVDAGSYQFQFLNRNKLVFSIWVS